MTTAQDGSKVELKNPVTFFLKRIVLAAGTVDSRLTGFSSSQLFGKAA
jgi:hypothetical protein